MVSLPNISLRSLSTHVLLCITSFTTYWFLQTAKNPSYSESEWENDNDDDDGEEEKDDEIDWDEADGESRVSSLEEADYR